MFPLFALGLPGVQEWLVIAVVSLVVFGPKRLPEIARTLGRSASELRRAKEEFLRELPKISGEQAPRPPDEKR